MNFIGGCGAAQAPIIGPARRAEQAFIVVASSTLGSKVVVNRPPFEPMYVRPLWSDACSLRGDGG